MDCLNPGPRCCSLQAFPQDLSIPLKFDTRIRLPKNVARLIIKKRKIVIQPAEISFNEEQENLRKRIEFRSIIRAVNR